MANGDVNKVILVGRCAQDGILQHTNGGATVLNFTIATNKSWKDKEGQKKELAEFHRCQLWGKRAEACVDYARKGDQVYIEGELRTRQWEDKQGAKRSTTEIQVSNFQNFTARHEKMEDSGGGYDHSFDQREPGTDDL